MYELYISSTAAAVQQYSDGSNRQQAASNPDREKDNERDFVFCRKDGTAATTAVCCVSHPHDIMTAAITLCAGHANHRLHSKCFELPVFYYVGVSVIAPRPAGKT